MELLTTAMMGDGNYSNWYSHAWRVEMQMVYRRLTDPGEMQVCIHSTLPSVVQNSCLHDSLDLHVTQALVYWITAKHVVV